MASVSGLYEKVNVQRSTTANCLDAKRAAGEIR